MVIPSTCTTTPIQKSQITELSHLDVQWSFPFLLVIRTFIILFPPIRRKDNKSYCLQIMYWAQVPLSALQHGTICNRDHICTVLFCLAGLSFTCNRTYRNYFVIGKHSVSTVHFPLDFTCWKHLLPSPTINFLFCTLIHLKGSLSLGLALQAMTHQRLVP